MDQIKGAENIITIDEKAFVTVPLSKEEVEQEAKSLSEQMSNKEELEKAISLIKKQYKNQIDEIDAKIRSHYLAVKNASKYLEVNAKRVFILDKLETYITYRDQNYQHRLMTTKEHDMLMQQELFNPNIHENSSSKIEKKK